VESSTVRQQAHCGMYVRGMQRVGLPQLPLPLGRLFRQDVTAVRVVAFESAGGRFFESLCRTAIGLHLGHKTSLY
jgi:hypothetical protein